MTRTILGRASAVAGLVLIVTLLIGPGPVRAQAQSQSDAAVRVDVRPALDGLYAQGTWVELQVTLENAGPDIEVEVRADPGRGSGSYAVPVELPRGSDKVVPLLVRPVGAGSVRVTVRADDGVIEQTRSQLRGLAADERLVLVLASDDVRLNALEALDPSVGQAKTRVLTLRPHALPESGLALGASETIVLAGAELSAASTAAQQALAEWVALGGRLLVAGGTRAGVLDTLPERLRPAAAGEMRTLASLEGLGTALDTAPPAGEATAVVLEPMADAQTRGEVDGLPLFVARRFGNGHVIALAVDPSRPPLAGWDGLERLWRILGAEWPGPRTTASAPQLSGVLDSRLRSATSGSETLPSIGLFLAIMAGYIVLVGPVNYLVLRRRRRLDLAWVTIPAITLTASLLAYGTGYAVHGGQLILREAAVVRVLPGADLAHVVMAVDLFSPTARSYDVALEHGYAYPALNRPSGPRGNMRRFLQGESPTVRSLYTDQWSETGFTVEGVVPWPADEPGQLSVERGRVVGEVRNTLGRSLEHVMIVTPAEAESLGRLTEGARRAIDLRRGQFGDHRLDMTWDGNDADDDRALVRGALLGAVMRASTTRRVPGAAFPGVATNPRIRGTRVVEATGVRRIHLFGWSDAPPFDVDVSGERADWEATTLVHTLLFPEEQTSGGNDG